MPKSQKCEKGCTCGCNHCGKNHKHKGPLSVISRTLCGLLFIAAAALVLLNIFNVITLDINVGILVAVTAISIAAIYCAFHFIWAGLFFPAAVVVTILSANGIFFCLDGPAIGNLYIAAALLTIAFHIIFRHNFFYRSKSGTEVSFSSSVKHFEGELDTAHLECNFGNIKAYFEKSQPKNNQANINLECNFASIELFVPKTWRVSDHTRSSFGGTEEKNHSSPAKDAPTLTLTGEINFGGLTITYI